MDAKRFDGLARRVGDGGSRRRMPESASRRSLLQRLSALPLGVGFASLVATADAREGKDKRNGGNGKHDEDHKVAADKNRSRRRNAQCKRKKARACKDRCGTVTVQCKKRNGKTKRTQVNCGSCACDPPCGRCATCTAARRCEPCDGCCADGQCVATCAACETCLGDGNCSAPCDGSGCCAGTTCEQGDSNAACGTGGAACVSCTLPETCGGGNPGTPGVCGCTATNPCTDGVCGTVLNNCGQNIDCGGCDNPTPICVNHVCTACDSTNPCPGSQCCSGGQCVADCPACQSCSAGVCAPCANCCADDICQAGDTWAQCGSGNVPCAQCATGTGCETSSQTCVSCDFGLLQRGTFCDVRNNFARFQCGSNCGCGVAVQGGVAGGSLCWNVSATAYCSSSRPICEYSADCVDEGLGDYCIAVGDCDIGCVQTVCVPRCGAGDDEGPHQLVLLD